MVARTTAATLVACGFLGLSAFAQVPAGDAQPAEQRLCGQPIAPPAQLPPAGSEPVVFLVAVCFSAQGDVSAIEPETYLYYIQLRPSLPSRGQWVAYDDQAQAAMRADFRRLWDTAFLEDLRIEVDDFPFANGVIGKLVTYHLEERERIKVVQYQGTKQIDRTRIDERLRELRLDVRLDSFLDANKVASVKRALREMMAEKGFIAASVTHAVTPVAGGPRLVNLTFTIDEGSKVRIRDVEFVGNAAVDDGRLQKQLKENKPRGLLSFMTGTGTYNQAAYEDDAQRVVDFYRNEGYVGVRVGQPELKVLEESGGNRWIQLRIPVTEGERYRVSRLEVDGNTLVTGDVLQPLFKLKPGEWYSDKPLRDGLQKARELYGSAGYMEFTGFPDITPEDRLPGEPDATVAVTMRLTEGPQYIVNRLNFSGNTTTRDHVIRREVRLLEGGVFDSEALKYSIRRLNQLGYFKQLEGNEGDVQVQKVPGRPNAVDVTLKLEEQNRNQMQFGAGLSQYEGVFGNISFTTANFLGRGETLSITGQKGARSSVYQLSFTEPYVFDRPMTAGFELFSRRLDYQTAVDTIGYSEVRSGINLTAGHALFRFARGLVSYGYEVIDTAVSDDLIDDLTADQRAGIPLFNPFLDEGRHIESRVNPSFVHNTVDSPFMPRRGMRLTLSAPIAGGLLGGTTNYIRPEAEGIVYLPHTSRTALGVRVSGGWVRPYGSTATLPYYLRFFLGGDQQIRGVDIRTVGPTDGNNRALGGNRFVLFNAEYYLDLFGRARLLAFHDAGQAFGEDQGLDLGRLRTSSGAEVRVMVPMLNVPFRLIYAWNVYRDSFQPARTIKFAVGTMF
jgi:outer membrane protein insertion porin family